MTQQIHNRLFKKVKWQLFLLGLFKIPMIGFLRPKLFQLNNDSVSIKIRLRRRSKNHLNSMYFGALAVGADLAAGIHVFYFSELNKMNTSFAFKGMQVDFLKRAETDVVFRCSEGSVIQSVMKESQKTGERINKSINVEAFNLSEELVASFQMVISVKVK